jgi:predicted AAA+ superfamily ATPase
MDFIPRTLGVSLLRVLEQYHVVYLTGPRQSGKTTLARHMLPDFRYLSLEQPRTRDEAINDPERFLSRVAKGATGVILDEVQRAPELFSYLQGFVDDRRGGPFVLTGSQNFLLSQSITQSLAGRVAVLELLPFSLAELHRRAALEPRDYEASLANAALPHRPSGLDLDDLLFTGLLPPIHDRGLPPTTWLDGYVTTYVERDVRQVAAVGDLVDFQRFMGLCAGRVGQLLNHAALAEDAGIDRKTARRWLSVLQASYVITLLSPHFVNFSRRLIKTPKLYFLDTGLVCNLLGITAVEQIRTHPLRGAIFENLVIGELLKVWRHNGERPHVYFWRDRTGREVDALLDFPGARVPLEAKAGETLTRSYFKGLGFYRSLQQEAKGEGSAGEDGPFGVLVYGGDDSGDHWGHTVRPWWAVS